MKKNNIAIHSILVVYILLPFLFFVNQGKYTGITNISSCMAPEFVQDQTLL